MSAPISTGRGTGPRTAELLRMSELGPCRAEVVAESVELASGGVRFRVTETWQPVRSHAPCEARGCDQEATAELYDPEQSHVRFAVCEPCCERFIAAHASYGRQLERAVLVGTLTEMTLVGEPDDPDAGAAEAVQMAAAAAQGWRRGSLRSEQLAPGGRLRAG